MIAVLLACRTPDGPPTGTEPSYVPYDPVQYVDPFVGTGGLGAQVAGVSPGAAVPLGMTLVGPDTRHSVTGAPGFYHFGGYHYDDDQVTGFSHTHSHGMGVNDFVGVLVMGRAAWDPAYTTDLGRATTLDHDVEEATPGWYAVELVDEATQVEIAATLHGAHHRYTFADGGEPTVLVDLGHVMGDMSIGADTWIEVDAGAQEIVGFQRTLGSYSGRFGGLETSFVVHVDPAPVAVGAWSDPATPVADATTAAGSTAGAWLVFAPGVSVVDVRTALSYVDLDGARANLAAELPDTTLEARRDEARAAWAGALDGVHVWGGADEPSIRTIFHTAQYHALLMPRRYVDVDGRYRGLDGEVHTADFGYLSDLSLWDTFRTLHPWWTLALPEAEVDFARSMVRMIEDGGAVPRWPLGHGYTGGMIGSPGCIALADTWLKGLRDGWDADLALDACLAQARGPTSPEGREHVEDWVGLGYVPAEFGSSTSLTLEYAWADAALANWADAAGRASDAEEMRAQAAGWRNAWDPAVGFHHARNRDGTFTELEGEFVWADEFTEGNAWHYVWTVPYDVPALIDVQHGGDAGAFADRYAAFWESVYLEPDDQYPDDHYWHGNEPVLHYAWLGSFAGRPDLTAEAARWVSEHRYGTGPDGLDGNDDAGTLSAWYLFAALGIYPVAGTDQYAVGQPLVDHAEIDGVLVIDAARGATGEVLVDGEALDGAVITHERLVGAHLEFR